VPLDREDTLKKADKLLKQGKVSGAIEEYVRLVEDRPNDWNSVNALGDLYVKAGDSAKAAEQFTRAADHLFDEGFLPRAAAVYKKVLKVRGDDDHSLWRLGVIAGQNGVGVDARTYFGRLIKDRQAAGNQRGVVDCVIQLGLLEDADAEARTASARALVSIGEKPRAARVMLGVGKLLSKEGRLADAFEALRQASELDPQNQEIQDRLAAATPPPALPEVSTEVNVEAIADFDREEPQEVSAPATDVYVVDAHETDVVVDLPSEPEGPEGDATSPSEPLLLDSVFEAIEAQVRPTRVSSSPGPDGVPPGDPVKGGNGGE